MNIALNVKEIAQCHTLKGPVWLAATQHDIQGRLGILGAQHHTGARGDMKINTRQCGNDQTFLDTNNNELYRLSL